MFKFFIFSLIFLCSSSVAFARLSYPGTAPQAYDLSSYQPSSYINLRGSTAGVKVMYPVNAVDSVGTQLVSVGAAGLTTRAVATLGRISPYISLALLGYSTYQALRDIALKDDASRLLYPTLAPALEGYPDLPMVSVTSHVNDVVNTPYGPKKVTGVSVMTLNTAGCQKNPDYATSQATFVSAASCITQCSSGYVCLAGPAVITIVFYVTTIVPKVPYTDSKTMDNLNGTASPTAYDANLDPAYMADLAKLIKNNPSAYDQLERSTDLAP